MASSSRPRRQLNALASPPPTVVARQAPAQDPEEELVLARIWRAQIDESRSGDYEGFVERRSLPMFRSHQGFQGVLFLRNAGDCLVITLWDSPAAIDALEASSRYQETVAEIMATGFIRRAGTVEVFDLHAGVTSDALSLLGQDHPRPDPP
jgi:heme-degrading monooxygenase HmoA